jgi:hypothetical protein
MQILEERLNKAQKVLFKYALQKAETERIYRMDLAQEILRLRAEGVQAVLIADISRGSVSQEKFQRDFADAQYRSAIESMESIRVQMSALQSILRYQTDI